MENQWDRAGNTFMKNKNIFCSALISAIAILTTFLIINTVVGLAVFYFDSTQHIQWNILSPYLMTLLVLVMAISVLLDIYAFRSGGLSLAEQIGARRLHSIESVPEESIALKIAEQFAKKYEIETPALYVLPDEIGINVITAGFHPKNTAIILTWGALYHLDEVELYGLLGHEFIKIYAGETAENTRLKILYSPLTTFSQWGSKIAKIGSNQHAAAKKFEAFFVALGGMIWLIGSLGVLNTRLIKYVLFSGRTLKNDQKAKEMLDNKANIQTLLRIHVHHAGSQIYSEYAESFAHMCFANSLSPQNWLNIHPEIEERIYELNPGLLQDLQLENLRKIKKIPLYSLFRSLDEANAEVYLPWTVPEPLPLLRLSPISFAINDAIKPLNPELRASAELPELLERALQTATGSREVIVAVLMIRQYREFIPANAAISRAIVDALLHIDGRRHISIFRMACKNIGQMPATISRQFLTKLALIIQDDGEKGLLDALLLEVVKYELGLFPIHKPTALQDAKPQIVRLIDALLHVQQINSENQLGVRESILKLILNADEVVQYSEITDEAIDLAEILNELAGLLLRDRLTILGVAEVCLWNDRIITQDELDVLELLYWRLGFRTEEMLEIMHKKNSVMIV